MAKELRKGTSENQQHLSDTERAIAAKEKELEAIQSAIDKITRQQSHSIVSPAEAAQRQKELLNDFRLVYFILIFNLI